MDRGKVIWLTGLSGVGKSTIAIALKDFLRHDRVKIGSRREHQKDQLCGKGDFRGRRNRYSCRHQSL
jgi:thymidylate kinase